MIGYLVEAALFQAFAVSIYRLIWYRHNRLGWNRTILLGIVMISLLVPFLTINSPIASDYITSPDVWVEDSFQEIYTVQRVAQLETKTVLYQSVLLWAYSAVAVLLLIRYIVLLIKLTFNQKNHRITRHGKVYSTPYPFAYSFFNRIHVPNTLREYEYLETIMLHEKQHASLGHSWDRLLMGLVSVLLWFNPFTYLLKRYLIEVHEFEADEKTVEITKEPLQYQWLLLEQSSVQKQTDLINHFAFSNTKRRLQMINNNKQTIWKYLLILPVIGTLTGIFAFEQKTDKILPISHLSSVDLIHSDPIFQTLAEVKNDIPSILPLKVDRNEVRVSSHWGERKDPYSKEMRHHFGMDLVAETGTPVIATAAGTVVKVGNQPNGYGNFVIVEHSNAYKTRYAQMKNAVVKEGDRVQSGQTVGLLGSSGRSTGPHLHYEVYKDGKRVNPSNYIQDFKTE